MTGRPSPREAAWHALSSVDFARALAAPQRSRGPHFVLHHVAESPSPAPYRRSRPVIPELSTVDAPFEHQSVDDLPVSASAHWFGLVVPKRHAKRSVTRTLLRRQMREVLSRNINRLPTGLWLLRLRAPFDPRQFTSAASAALRLAARTELDALLQRVPAA